MLKLHESTVTDDQIDSLGHLNVRFYLSRVDAAARELFARAGVDEATLTRVQRIDTYSQFKREQFEGARLTVHGGLLGAEDDQARAYFEIRNPERDELAGLFITGSVVTDAQGEGRQALPEVLSGVNEMFGVQLPDYAVPRSIQMTPPRTDIALAELEAVIPEEQVVGMAGGRREGVVLPEDCDSSGRLRSDVELMFLLHRSYMEQLEKMASEDPTAAGEMRHGPPVQLTEEGHRFSWAMMETRTTELARPRSGDRLVFLGADLDFGDKTRRTRRWMFVADTGELLSIHESVGVAIDLDARRAIRIPDAVRAELEQTCLPQFA